MEPLIQIAGVIDREEADLLINAGIKYLGFPLRLPVNKEDLSEDEAAELIKTFPKNIIAVLITYLNNADDIDAFCEKLNVNMVQLHGDISVDELRKLKIINPVLSIIKSLVVRNDNLADLEETVKELSPYCDYFITDTFDPNTGATGATGKTHDWSVSRRLVELSNKPVILAGGLNPENVKEAILQVKPAGVDSHTGVENKEGRKTKELIDKFISESLEAFTLLKG